MGANGINGSKVTGGGGLREGTWVCFLQGAAIHIGKSVQPDLTIEKIKQEHDERGMVMLSLQPLYSWEVTYIPMQTGKNISAAPLPVMTRMEQKFMLPDILPPFCVSVTNFLWIDEMSESLRRYLETLIDASDEALNSIWSKVVRPASSSLITP